MTHRSQTALLVTGWSALFVAMMAILAGRLLLWATLVAATIVISAAVVYL